MGFAALAEDPVPEPTLPVVLGGESGSKSVSRMQYSADLAARILDLYAAGKRLSEIARMAEMPDYNTLLRWAKKHPEFSRGFAAMKTMKALHHEDEALRAAEEADGKDADRLRFEAHKWAAEVNDPHTYGKKVTVGGDASNPIVLQVITGFGPPNPWQTPPKLNADGTIQKAEVVDGREVPGPECLPSLTPGEPAALHREDGAGSETRGERGESVLEDRPADVDGSGSGDQPARV